MQNSTDSLFEPYLGKMRSAGIPEIVIKSFHHYFQRLVEGAKVHYPESEIDPISTIPDADKLEALYLEKGRRELPHTVVIKLNGGLGTSMGLEHAKSLLEVKNGLTFLDVIATQAVNSSVPLLLMNSFTTREDSLAKLEPYLQRLKVDLPLDFLQHQVPKIRRSDFCPASYPENPSLEWCPPGHGDLYLALVTSGLLGKLLEQGYRTAFVSNSDNLGASLDYSILGYFVAKGFSFLMEVTDRTKADRKGGHLAHLKKNDNLILRESAQCPVADLVHFQNIRKHRYFNTNNLWINLETLSSILQENDGFLRLPLIRNSKNVNPADPSSYRVFQLETAMGSAISVFPGASAIRVQRNRFLPVKTTDDLILVQSDATILNDEYLIQPAFSDLDSLPSISLERKIYGLIEDLKNYFPYGPPSLKECKSLRITGRIHFGRDIVVRGDTELENPSDTAATIPNGTILEGRYRF
jgi:UTP--glucose-1-phosphate uridylyltransferase